MNTILRKRPHLMGFNGYQGLSVQQHTLASQIWSYREQKQCDPSGKLNGIRIPYVRQLNPYGSLFSDRIIQMNFNLTRQFSLSAIVFEQASSKVEVTVKTIKEKQKEKEEISKISTIQQTGVDSLSCFSEPKPEEKKVVRKKPLKEKIMDELRHYYHGFRLLGIDIKVSTKLLWRVLNGHTLTRREYRLLIRTTSDLFRLVPFSIFIIVPFLEFALPLFIKFFPNMLPSTFQTAKDNEKKIKQNLRIKLEMAKFLQRTLDEMAVQNKEHRSEEAREFGAFIQKVRSGGGHAATEGILKFSKLFEDEITLDSLTRQQLVALCKVLDVSTIGTSNILRFQLRMKLRSLAADDRMIQKEGVNSLNLPELQAACRARGMRSYGLSEQQLRDQLEEWIDLSLNEKVPPSLLLMSRALMMPEELPTADKLKASIKELHISAAIQTKGAIGEREGKIDNKTKIEIIKDEERKIKEEMEELKEVLGEKLIEIKETLMDRAPTNQAHSEPSVKPGEISSKDLEVLNDALGTIAKDNKILLIEKEELKDLKEEIADYKEDVEELNVVAKEVKGEVQESKAAKLLLRKVDSMINNLEMVLNNLEKVETKIQSDIDKVETIQLAVAECKSAPIQEDLVHVDELVEAVRKMQKVPDEARIQQMKSILGKIDVDHDGHIRIEDVMKVVREIAKENVKIKENQLDEILDLLNKEEWLETEQKIQEKLEATVLSKLKAKAATQQQQLNTTDIKETDPEVLSDGPLLKDTAKELNQPADSKDASSDKSSSSPTVNSNLLFKDPAIVKEAVIKTNEKMIASSDLGNSSTPLPPTIGKPEVNSTKDKML